MDCVFQKFNTTAISCLFHDISLWICKSGEANTKHTGYQGSCLHCQGVAHGISCREAPAYSKPLTSKERDRGDCASLAESTLGEVHANLQLTQAVSSPTKKKKKKKLHNNLCRTSLQDKHNNAINTRPFPVVLTAACTGFASG